MIGFLLFILGLIFGVSLVRLLPLKLSKPEFFATASVVGLLAETWVFFITALIFPYVIAIPLAVVLIILATAGVLYFKRQEKFIFETEWTKNRKTVFVWELFSVAILGLFSYLFYTHMLEVHPDGFYSAGPTWGDINLHITLITHFASQAKIVLDFPLFVDSKLSYPFLIDFLSSIFYRTGLSLQMSLILPDIILAFSFVQLLIFLTYRLLKSITLGIVTALLFLFNGSFAAIYYFFQDVISKQLPVLLPNYTDSVEHNLRFSNILISNILPQRSFLFGFSIFCLVLIILHQMWQQQEKVDLKLGISAGLLMGFLPFAHTHTFLVLVFIYLWLGIVTCYVQKKLLLPWVVGAAIFLILAAPQFAWQLSAGFHSGFGHFKFGWTKLANENIITFWLRNMGLGLLLLFANIYVLIRYFKDRFHLHIYLSLFVIFIVTNIYSFQPNEYDNNKFFLFTYLMTVFYGSWVLKKLAHKNHLLAFLLILGLVFPGGLALASETQRSWPLFSNDDVALAAYVKANTPAEAIFLTSDQHNHPVSALAGRHILMGYRGWLWTYGIDYAQVDADEHEIFQGDSEAEKLLQKYDVSYVAISKKGNVLESGQWATNSSYFREKYSVAYESDTWLLIKVTP